MLTLIKKVPRPEDKKRTGTYWECKCDCGNICVKHYQDLYSGDTKSCGCLQKRKPIFDKNNFEISNRAGVYGFQNIYNNHWYIGKSKNLYSRYCQHKKDWNNHQEKQFYQAIKKYGWDSFNYYILKEYLEVPSAEELSKVEEYFIQKYNSFYNGYNATNHSSGGFSSQKHKETCTQILNNLNETQKNENHPRTDFSKEDIINIFNLALQGAPAKYVYSLYENHNITYDSFKSIYRGEHFKDYLPDNWENRPVVTTNSKMWGSWIIDIRTRYLRKEPLEEIYKDYSNKCSKLDFQRIIQNKTYKQIYPCID